MAPEQEIVTRPKRWLQPPRHRRSVFDAAGLRLLKDNIEAIGLLNPIECLPTGEIIAGDRRWQAIMLSDVIDDVLVRIVSDPKTAKDIRVRRVSENLQREDLSFWDKYMECTGFRDDEPGITLKEIAAAIHVDASSVTRYLCLDHCGEEVRVAARDGQIGLKASYQLSKLPRERQAEQLARLLARGKGKKHAAGTVPPAARPGRFKLPLPSGYTVVIGNAGGAVTVKDAIRELLAAVSVLKEAEKEGLGQKAIAAVSQDKAMVKRPKPAAEATHHG